MIRSATLSRASGSRGGPSVRDARVDRHLLHRCGGCRQPATRRDADDVANVCQFCGEESDWVRATRERHEKQLTEQERI